jgi:hypothetical protein
MNLSQLTSQFLALMNRSDLIGQHGSRHNLHQPIYPASPTRTPRSLYGENRSIHDPEHL